MYLATLISSASTAATFVCRWPTALLGTLSVWPCEEWSRHVCLCTCTTETSNRIAASTMIHLKKSLSGTMKSRRACTSSPRRCWGECKVKRNYQNTLYVVKYVSILAGATLHLFKIYLYDGLVGVVSHYWLDDPVFETRWGQEIFLVSKTSRPALGPTQPPLQCVPGLFLRCKVAGARNWPLTSI